MAWIDFKKVYDMVAQSCLKMYKIPDQTVQFIEKTMQIRRGESTVGSQSLTEVKIQRGIFQEVTLSSWLLVIAMMPLNLILLKCTAGHKLSKLQEKNNHLMYMDDIKLLAKNEKDMETLIQTVRIYSQYIVMEFCIKNLPC